MSEPVKIQGLNEERTPVVFYSTVLDNFSYMEELKEYLENEFTTYDDELANESSFTINNQMKTVVIQIIQKIHLKLIEKGISMIFPKVYPLSKNEIDIHWIDEIGNILLNLEDDNCYYSAKLKQKEEGKEVRRKGGSSQVEAVNGIISFFVDYYPKEEVQNLALFDRGISEFIMDETPSDAILEVRRSSGSVYEASIQGMPVMGWFPAKAYIGVVTQLSKKYNEKDDYETLD